MVKRDWPSDVSPVVEALVLPRDIQRVATVLNAAEVKPA